MEPNKAAPDVIIVDAAIIAAQDQENEHELGIYARASLLQHQFRLLPYCVNIDDLETEN